MDTLDFDKDTHTYSIGGRDLPGVTTILAAVGLIEKRFFNDYAATRGTFVHKACALLDEGNLDESSIDPVIAGYVEAYRRFVDEYKPTWTEVEVPKHHKALGFAGTPDRLGSNIVVDIKTGVKAAWHGYQLAGYTILAGFPNNAKRLGLYLSDKGTYRLQEYSDLGDFAVFQSALTVYNARRSK